MASTGTFATLKLLRKYLVPLHTLGSRTEGIQCIPVHKGQSLLFPPPLGKLLGVVFLQALRPPFHCYPRVPSVLMLLKFRISQLINILSYSLNSCPFDSLS